MEYTISFRGEKDIDHKIFAVKRPDIPAPRKRNTAKTVGGRDGAMIVSDESYEPVEILITFNFMSHPDRWLETFREARRWLRGKGKLEFSDDADYLRKVYYCEITSSERTSQRIGTFEAKFVCDPAEYVKSGQQRLSPKLVAYNPYSISRPVYYITGEGECTLTVNGQRLVMDIYDNMVIDTERWISYREYDHTVYLLAHDGSPLLTESGVPLIRSYGHPGLINDHETRGDYTDLYLQEGDNTFSVSDGFELKITPNWRCL